MSKQKISVGGAVKPSKWNMKIISNIKSQLFREENTIQVGDEVKAPFRLKTDIQPELRKVGEITDDFEILENGDVVLNKRTQINDDWSLSTRDSQVDMVGHTSSQSKLAISDNGLNIEIADGKEGYMQKIEILGRTVNQLIPKIDLTEYNKAVEL